MTVSTENEMNSDNCDSAYKLTGSTLSAKDDSDEEMVYSVISPPGRVILPVQNSERVKEVSAEELGIDVETSRQKYVESIQPIIDKLDALTVDSRKSNSTLMTKKKYKFIQNLFMKTLEYESLRKKHNELKKNFRMESKEDEKKATYFTSSLKKFRIVDTFDDNQDKTVKDIWSTRTNWLQLYRLDVEDNHIKKFKATEGHKALKERGNLLDYECDESEFQGRVFQVEESFDVLLGAYLEGGGEMNKNAFAFHVSKNFCSFTRDIAKKFYKSLNVTTVRKQYSTRRPQDALSGGQDEYESGYDNKNSSDGASVEERPDERDAIKSVHHKNESVGDVEEKGDEIEEEEYVVYEEKIDIDMEVGSKKDETKNLLLETKKIETKKCTEVVLTGNSVEEVFESVAKEGSDEKFGKEYYFSF